tara:strand:+ start:1999 stop:2127 length:129 start_codon:yes stop_codon:yes gene_type:complete
MKTSNKKIKKKSNGDKKEIKPKPKKDKNKGSGEDYIFCYWDF